MKIAFINPHAHPDVLPNTHYHLLLAQYVLNNVWYRTKWFPRNRSPKDFVILDNGAAEEVQLTPGELVNACNIIKPDVLILPDVLGESSATRKGAEDFLESDAWRWEINTRPKLMFVPQGQNYWEWHWCLNHAVGDYIGLAKRYSTGDFLPTTCVFGRLELAEASADIYPSKRIHLLGLTRSRELLTFKSHPGLAHGVDTALPWVLAQHDITLPEYGLLYRPKDWHSNENLLYSTEQCMKAQHTAQILLRWAGAEGLHTTEEFVELCKALDFRCQGCGDTFPLSELTEDHMDPLSRGGSNDIDNIQPLCRKCNSEKSDKTNEEWIASWKEKG